MKAILGFLLLSTIALAQEAPASYDWIREGSYFKLYSMYLEDFIKEHPKTLVVIYDSSPFSQAVLTEIESIHGKLAQKGIKLHLAKLFHGDAERHIITWNVHHFPHLRLFVGEEVYLDLNMYPSSDNVFNELTRVLGADDTIAEIATAEDKERFLKEPLAFYMRFPKEKTEFIYFLEKIQQLDSRIKVYYTHKPELDPFKAVKPEDLVVGFRRDFDDPIRFIASEDRLDRNSILSFYHAYRQPDVHHLDEELLYAILSKKIRSVVFFEDEEKHDRIANFRRTAFQYKNEFMFVIAKPNSPAGVELRDFARIESGAGDVIRILVFGEKDVATFPVGLRSAAEMDQAISLFNKGALDQISDGPFIDGEL